MVNADAAKRRPRESREFNSSDDGGNEVFKVAVTELAHIVDETRRRIILTVLNWTGWFRIRLTAYYQCNGEKTRYVYGQCRGELDRHGNTSAASVPCALDEADATGALSRGSWFCLKPLAVDHLGLRAGSFLG